MPGSKSQEVDGLFERALAHQQAGRLAEAARDYEAVLRRKPHHRDALYQRATVAQQQGEYPAAVELLRKALASGANQEKCYNLLGLVLGALGRFQEAAASFDRALAIGNQPGVRANLANLHRQEG